MKIISKFTEKQDRLYSVRQPAIAFLGDSVTQGCFEVFREKGTVNTKFESEESYSAKVKHILGILFPSVPCNIINAGISGSRAAIGLERLECDVLSYNPDLVVVCFGLNDAQSGEKGINEYKDSLKKIFETLIEKNIEVIFMTPNLRADYIDTKITDSLVADMAKSVVENENEGYLEKYLNEARKLCKEMNVPVCDCAKIWKTLTKNGVDIMNILSNSINHPSRDMHWLFAYELVKTMFEENSIKK